ncbi:MAG: BTAD domain-containing putative transcriptional regulator [Halanaerobium sp.]|nr:BTAD domain-containing putative transcriptional regulator [Halanaerobium sp.]
MDDLVVKTRFIPPQFKKKLYLRKSLAEKLDSGCTNYPLTIVQAGPGFGKSSILSVYARQNPRHTFWYGIARSDRDPFLFLLHLIHSFKFHQPEIGEKTLNYLKEEGNYQNLLHTTGVFINEFYGAIEEECILILDDYQLLEGDERIKQMMEFFIENLPPNLHLIISTRQWPGFPSLPTWRLKGKVQEIKEEDLRFSSEEIKNFYIQYHNYYLSDKQASLLEKQTEGWIIALELIWQGIKKGIPINRIFERDEDSLKNLFQFMAYEVFSKLSRDVQDFLMLTSILRCLDVEICDSLCGWQKSKQYLDKLSDNGLFISGFESKYRYHYLFQKFLREQGKKRIPDWEKLHRKAGKIFLEQGDNNEAIYHFFKGDCYELAAETLEISANEFLRTRRYESFEDWVSNLPVDVFTKFPGLCLQAGDICRFSSRFPRAIEWYSRAEEIYRGQQDQLGLSKSLQKKAMVFLDTIQPARADALLEEALALQDREDQVGGEGILKLRIENLANHGRLKEAEELQQRYQGGELQSRSNLLARVKLRTGRFAEARQILQRKLQEGEEQREQVRIPQAHRETLLILSLINSFEGNGEEAREYALMGHNLGKKLHSLFLEAVSFMRLGHALQLLEDDTDKARKAYGKALELVDRMHIRRLRAEALMGLCLDYGFKNNLKEAIEAGEEGLQISLEAGDEWLANLLRQSAGIVLAYNGEFSRARARLREALQVWENLNDDFGQVVSLLWLAYLEDKEGGDEFTRYADRLMKLVSKYSYTFLFTRTSFFGGRDVNLMAPLLVRCYQQGIMTDFVREIIDRLKLPSVEFHPGYNLRIKTLGHFKVFRGDEEVPSADWQRKNARRLFKLFITHYGNLLSREQIFYYLWPDLEEKACYRDFRVALNALNHALEPARPPRTQPTFIKRKGSFYGINTDLNFVQVDYVQFRDRIKKAMKIEEESPEDAIKLYQDALSLYNGDFLPTVLYEDWPREKREGLKQLFLQAGENLAQIYYQQEEYEECIQVCDRILARDTCWEKAYYLKMQALSQQKRRSMAIEVYQRCEEVLHKELGVEPMEELTVLYNRLCNRF